MSDTTNTTPHGVRVIESDDGNTTRVQMRPDSGSIYNSSTNNPDYGQPVSGGLYSGGLPISQRGVDSSVRVVAGSPVLGEGYTARTADGFPIASADELRPDSVITLPSGEQTSYEVAKMLGLVSPEALRQPQHPEVDQRQQDVDQQQEQQHKETEPMAPEAEAIMREVITKAEGAAIGAAIDVIENDGVLSTANAEELASVLQVEPATIQERSQVALRGYQDDAYRGAARAARTDEALAAEALQDARQNRRSTLNEKMQHHFMHGTTHQYGEMVTDFVAGLGATDPTRVLSAETGSGITVSQDGQGEIILTIPEVGTMRYEDAVRGGHVVVTSGVRRS
jgi:hypothetical protein